MPINLQRLKQLISDKTNKTKPAIGEKGLIEDLITFMAGLCNYVIKFTIYDLAQWILGINNWIKQNRTTKFATYRRGQIVYIDFGPNNFGHELSYTHPSVVIFSQALFLVVIPGSTAKYGAKSGFIYDCTTGFDEPTGLMLDQIRYVSKSRVVTRYDRNGKPKIQFVGTDVLQYIDDFIFVNYCGNKGFQIEKGFLDIIDRYQGAIKQKDSEIKRLNTEIEKLNNRLDQRETEIIELKQKLTG